MFWDCLTKARLYASGAASDIEAEAGKDKQAVEKAKRRQEKEQPETKPTSKVKGDKDKKSKKHTEEGEAPTKKRSKK